MDMGLQAAPAMLVELVGGGGLGAHILHVRVAVIRVLEVSLTHVRERRLARAAVEVDRRERERRRDQAALAVARRGEKDGHAHAHHVVAALAALKL
mgnify:CR=1 FL=1